MSNKLQVIVNESGLEPTKAKILLDNFTNYFEMADEWSKKAKAISVTDASQTADIEMARVGRLFLQKERMRVEHSRKALKEQALREGKAIDGIANVLKALIVPIEQHLEKQEKFVEIKEKEAAELAQIKAERKIEEERIAKEKAEAEERERIRIENEKLKKEAEEREKKHKEEQAKAEAERKALEAKAKKEREEAEAKQRVIEEKAQKEKAEAEAKAEAIKKANDEKIRKQKEESDKIIREQQEKARIEREKLAEKTRKEKEKTELEKKRLEEQLRNQVECPKCHHKFQPNKNN